ILAWRAALAASLYDDALLVIESNSIETRDPNRVTDGDQTYSLLSRLRDIYPNLYARQRSQEDVRRGGRSKYGFHTNVATKQLVISTLVEAIRDKLYTERDQACIDEYLAYERRSDGSLGAIAGCHDDLLMTRAIGLYIIFHELPFPVARPVSRNSSGAAYKPPVSYAAW
ncbi:MAG: terminase, partial [Muribaculaceae bacterium]|nr:terminase [Muribaculaceae bacterium]